MQLSPMKLLPIAMQLGPYELETTEMRNLLCPCRMTFAVPAGSGLAMRNDGTSRAVIIATSWVVYDLWESLGARPATRRLPRVFGQLG